MKPYIIGLTGGIACGKTAVSDVLAERGAYVIDADIVSRAVVEPHTEGFKRLKEQFPSAFDENGLNRRVLKTLVFADKEKLKRLDGIMFPLIKKEVERRIAECPKEVAVLVAPLLFESGFDSMADVIVSVSASTDVRLKRLIERDNISVETAVGILSSQLTDEERESRSDVVIRNDGSIKELRDKATTVYNEIVERMN